jgi:hypothetical protein
MDRALLIAGVALLAASPMWWPWLLAPAWAAIGLGLFTGLARSSEHAIPRPGRRSGAKRWTSPDEWR